MRISAVQQPTEHPDDGRSILAREHAGRWLDPAPTTIHGDQQLVAVLVTNAVEPVHTSRQGVVHARPHAMAMNGMGTAHPCAGCHGVAHDSDGL